jgi:hypothetical protein
MMPGAHRLALEDALRAMRAVQQFNWEQAAPGMRMPEPHPVRIVETICFADSKKSRALQLADLSASIIGAQLREEAFVQPFFNLLRLQLQSSVAPLFLGLDDPHTARKPQNL